MYKLTWFTFNYQFNLLVIYDKMTWSKDITQPLKVKKNLFWHNATICISNFLEETSYSVCLGERPTLLLWGCLCQAVLDRLWQSSALDDCRSVHLNFLSTVGCQIFFCLLVDHYFWLCFIKQPRMSHGWDVAPASNFNVNVRSFTHCTGSKRHFFCCFLSVTPSMIKSSPVSSYIYLCCIHLVTGALVLISYILCLAPYNL